MKERLSNILKEIKEKGNYRALKYIRPISATKVILEGREFLNLCSNSYLSIHCHEEVLKAAMKAIEDYGLGTCSSRSVSGSIDLYNLLEDEIAEYKSYSKALIFSSGYLANIGIISTLTTEDDVIFSDELNHSSLIHSMRLSKAKKVIYRHRDMNDLEAKIRDEKVRGERFIVTESIFSMDGDIAPLKDIYELKHRYMAHVIIDDAHGTGVFGDKGTGMEEEFGLSGKMDVQMATFGKALGSFGAFALGDDTIIDFLINRAKTFMYTTALPPATIAGSLAALQLVKRDFSFKGALWRNISYMRNHLEAAGLDLMESKGPIIPIVVGEDKKAVEMQQMLMEKGLFIQAIRPPTVPEGTSRLRLTVVSGFTKKEMDYAIETIICIAERMGIIY